MMADVMSAARTCPVRKVSQVVPSDLGKPTCGTGVADGRVAFFSITNEIAVQVATVETEAMADMRKLLSALP